MNILLLKMSDIWYPLNLLMGQENILFNFGWMHLTGISTSAIARPFTPFNPAALISPGDEVRYGSYLIRKIGDRVFQINDPGDKGTRGGGWGVDMYLVCGTKKALMIDLGNNYITGYEKDLIKPRANATEELLSVIDELAGKLPLEIASHPHAP